MTGFLPAIWGDGEGFGEIRLMSEGRVEQVFYPLAEARRAEDLAMLLRGQWDVYYGVLPRVREGGTADDTVDEASVLWADIDAKRFPHKPAALRTIRRMLAQPSILVDSGHGFHAYWRLRDDVPWDTARAAMKGIARELGGDAVYDRPRILRVPGTYNHKDQPPAQVRLLQYDLFRSYSINDLYDYVEAGSDRPVPGGQHASSRLAKQDLPEWLLDKIRHGAPRGARSEAVWTTALWMLRYGYDAEHITQVITAFPDGIGAKYFEKGRDGDRWLARVISSAQESA